MDIPDEIVREVGDALEVECGALLLLALDGLEFSALFLAFLIDMVFDLVHIGLGLVDPVVELGWCVGGFIVSYVDVGDEGEGVGLDELVGVEATEPCRANIYDPILGYGVGLENFIGLVLGRGVHVCLVLFIGFSLSPLYTSFLIYA